MFNFQILVGKASEFPWKFVGVKSSIGVQTMKRPFIDDAGRVGRSVRGEITTASGRLLRLRVGVRRWRQARGVLARRIWSRATAFGWSIGGYTHQGRGSKQLVPANHNVGQIQVI